MPFCLENGLFALSWSFSRTGPKPTIVFPSLTEPVGRWFLRQLRPNHKAIEDKTMKVEKREGRSRPKEGKCASDKN